MNFQHPSIPLLMAALAVLSACGGSSSGGNTGGSGTTSNTGGAAASGGGTAASGGGGTTANGGAPGTNTCPVCPMDNSGAGGGCPQSRPTWGTPCNSAESCTYEDDLAPCGPGMVHVDCVNHKWQVKDPLTCAPLADTLCDPIGTWHVTLAPPFNPSFTTYADPFDVVVSVEPDGLVYVDQYQGTLSADGCQLGGLALLDSSCEEVECQTYTADIYRTFTLDLSTVPATGSVEIKCVGECGDQNTAPIEATKLP